MLQKLKDLAQKFKYSKTIDIDSVIDAKATIYDIYVTAVQKAGLVPGDPNLMYDLEAPELLYCCEPVNDSEELLRAIEFEKRFQFIENKN